MISKDVKKGVPPLILYQLSKWMEERRKLLYVIKETRGDVSLLQYKKEQVDEQMRVQANRWMYNEDVSSKHVPVDVLASEDHSEIQYY